MKADPLKTFPELGDDDTGTGRAGPDSGGQSGDTQGLSSIAEAGDESVEDLVDAGQDFEADVILGVEDAGDHPEAEVPSHETGRRPRDLYPE